MLTHEELEHKLSVIHYGTASARQRAAESLVEEIRRLYMVLGLETRSCARCGKEFVVGGGAKEGSRRADKKTCSVNCRVALYRSLKKEKKPRTQKVRGA